MVVQHHGTGKREGGDRSGRMNSGTLAGVFGGGAGGDADQA
jgi:hypothetical protein